MRRMNLLLAVLIGMILYNPVWAQHTNQSSQKSMSSGSMKGYGMHSMMGMMEQMNQNNCPMMGSMDFMHDFYLNKAKELGLSDSQIQQLEKIKIETQKNIIKKQADLRIAQLELNELLKDPQAKRSELEALAKKVNQLQSDIQSIKINGQLEARSVLNPEQLKKAISGSMSMHGKGMMQKNGMSNCPMMGEKSGQGNAEDHTKHHPGN